MFLGVSKLLASEFFAIMRKKREKVTGESELGWGEKFARFYQMSMRRRRK